jgi:hypothetical protein
MVIDLNVGAHALAKLGSVRAAVPSGIFVQELMQSSITEVTDHLGDTSMPDRQVLTINPAWTQVFIDYIKEHRLPSNKVVVEQVTR